MIDLSDLMDERSAHGVPVRGRLEEVQRRIAVRRRRRATLGTAAAVTALVVAGASTVALGEEPTRQAPSVPGSAAPPAAQPTNSPSTAPSPVRGRRIGPFAEYAGGYRVVAAGEAPVSSKKVELSWTVSSTDVEFFTYCPGLPGRDISLDVEVAVDGESSAAAIGCRPELAQHPTQLQDQTSAKYLGVSVGETVTLNFTVSGAQAGGRLPTIPRRGTLHVAVAEKVPFTEFPLPPRPAKLTPPKPDGMASEPGTRIVHSDPADPNKPISITMPWHRGYDFTVVPQTPGIYRISVNGVSVLAGEVYDYSGNGPSVSCRVKRNDQGLCVPDLRWVKDGDNVTITVTAEHATGPWLAELRSQWQTSSGQG